MGLAFAPDRIRRTFSTDSYSMPVFGTRLIPPLSSASVFFRTAVKGRIQPILFPHSGQNCADFAATVSQRGQYFGLFSHGVQSAQCSTSALYMAALNPLAAFAAEAELFLPYNAHA